ncbi:MAG: hypothetical protein ACD_65C00050G0003 [uncultured bacterium]|nr:MAG: hypothetical protein ACD_65C00050G0003 [uncultured bacterium]
MTSNMNTKIIFTKFLITTHISLSLSPAPTPKIRSLSIKLPTNISTGQNTACISPNPMFTFCWICIIASSRALDIVDVASTVSEYIKHEATNMIAATGIIR